jgi:peptide/nickel transport system permease protein
VAAAPEIYAQRSLLSRFRLLQRAARVDWVGWTAVVFLVILAIVCLAGQELAPYDARDQELLDRLTPPAWTAEGTSAHLLGTDALGRDLLSRIMVGARLTVFVGLAAAALEVAIGALLGLVAGYAGGRVGWAIMRWTDIQMAFPALLVILLVMLMLGPSVMTMILAIALNGWMVFARLTRAEVVRIKNEPFVQAAQVAGMHHRGVLGKHVLPHLRGRLVAAYLMEIPRVILVASGLSFIGLGITDPQISWGGIIGDGRSVISVAGWVSIFAGLAIVVTVASLYIFASWLEARIDPLRRLSNTRRGLAPLQKEERG